MKKIFSKLLQKRKKGEVAVEWTILAPVIFAITFMSIMFLIFCVDYLRISNICSDIAQEMNMGDTGYKDAASMAASPVIRSIDFVDPSTMNFGDKEARQLMYYTLPAGTGGARKQWNFAMTHTSEGTFEKAFLYKVGKFVDANVMKIPFVTVEELQCQVVNNTGHQVTDFNTKPKMTESGDMIHVTMRYHFLIFNVTQNGYSFII